MISLPPALPKFEKIKRYWDPTKDVHIAQILPGEVYVTREHEIVSTLLGSCIAVCMRDKINRIGGMNHFKLPMPAENDLSTDNTNYGIFAMELLINAILKNGGNKAYLECTVFGGGNVASTITSDIGGKNLKFVLNFLKNEAIPIIRQDTGHNMAQQVYYHPRSGDTFSVIKQNSTLTKIKKAEKRYLASIASDSNNATIEFF